MSVIKMHVVISGIGGDSASIDVPADGTLEAIELGMGVPINGSIAAGDSIGAEISFLSTAQIGGGHDSRGSLCEAGTGWVLISATVGFGGLSPICFQNGIDVRVNAGERIFIHGLASQADISGEATGYLFIKDKLDARPSTRRR